MATVGDGQTATTGPNPSLVAARPAESLTIVGAIAFLIARALGVDNDTTMTALAMVIAFTPAAITWLVELFARGKAQAPQTPPDAVADQLKDLVKAVREDIASKSAAEPTKTAVDAADFVDAVGLVLAERREGEARPQETARDAVADEVKNLTETVREGVVSMRRPEPSQRPVLEADLLREAIALGRAVVDEMRRGQTTRRRSSVQDRAAP